MTDTSRLGGGSIVEVNGDLYIKTEIGKLWQELTCAGLPCRLPEPWDGEVEVIREMEWTPLRGYSMGTVISFDNGTVAQKLPYNHWGVIGHSGTYTEEDLLEMIKDEDSIRILT